MSVHGDLDLPLPEDVGVMVGKDIAGNIMVSYNYGVSWQKVDLIDLALNGSVHLLKRIQEVAERDGFNIQIGDLMHESQKDAKLVGGRFGSLFGG